MKSSNNIHKKEYVITKAEYDKLTEEYNKLKEMSLNDAVEYLKQNPKESVKVTLSEDERSKQNIWLGSY